MHPRQKLSRRHPFRLTVRRQMILVGYSALLAAVVAQAPGGGPDSAGAWALVLLSPLMLGTLIASFDRPGPVRNWAVILSLSLCYPAIAVAFDANLAVGVWRSGEWPSPWRPLAFNFLIGAPYVAFLARMWPRRCPGCSERALIPLLRPGGQSGRLNGTRCCAACAGLYWRDHAGHWRPERRATWVVPVVVAGVDCSEADTVEVFPVLRPPHVDPSPSWAGSP